LQMEPLYRDVTSGHEVVESQLGESFAEYLNAEIALRNVMDMEGARRWLSSTFLFVRVSWRSLHI
jgi:ATP-dependent DNA helicase HFM1/MER3